MSNTTKIILVSIISFLSLLSAGFFFYFKILITKYNDQPVEILERKSKNLIFLMLLVLLSMFIVTIVAIILSKKGL